MRVMLKRVSKPDKDSVIKIEESYGPSCYFTKVNIKGYFGDSPLIMRSAFVALRSLDISPLTLKNIFS